MLLTEEIAQPVSRTTSQSVAAEGLLKQHTICLLHLTAIVSLPAGGSFTEGLAVSHGPFLERAAGHNCYAPLR